MPSASSNIQNSLGTVEWIQPAVKKGGPPTIKNHTVTAHNGYLYCFGGYDGHINHMSLLVYDIEEQQWITVRSENEIDHEFNLNHNDDYIVSNERSGMNGRNNGRLLRHGNDNTIYSRRMRTNHNLQNNNDSRSHMRRNNEEDGREDGVQIRSNNSSSIFHPQHSRQRRPYRQPYSVGNPPVGRNGHTATLASRSMNGDEDRVCIFIIGGWLGSGPFAADDLHILDITNPQELIWLPPANILRQQQVKGIQSSGGNNQDDGNTTNIATTNTPGPCNMHSADLIPTQNEIYVFRGGNGCEYLNELHALDVNKLTWRVVETDGEIPQQRANHSSSYLEESCQLFIFGGWNGRERLNDIHILDTKTSTWTRPYIHGSLPHPRAGMSLTALRGKLYLFGGSGTSSKCFHDLHVLDPVEMTWLEVMQDTEQSNSSSLSNNNTDDSRKGRSFQDEMHLFDDSDWRGHELVDQHRFDSLLSRGDDNMHSSNMTNAANPNEIENEPCISIRGTGPGRRAGHSATAVDRFIYVFGGSCGSDYLSDFFVLDTDPVECPQVTYPTSQQLVGRRLKYLFNKEEFADVVFIVDGQRVYAHKMVLALVSDFYAAMFSVSNGFRETSSECPEIDVPNCSYDAFLCIMEYIYSGNDPNFDLCNLEQVVDILQMADQLLLDHLKQRCEQVLQAHVDEESVAFLHQVSQKTNALQLLSVCNHFLRNH